MLPGLVSDVLAVLILIPGVQTAFRNIAMRTLAKRQQAMMDKMMGGMGGNGWAKSICRSNAPNARYAESTRWW